LLRADLMAALEPNRGTSARRLLLAAALPLAVFEFLVRAAPHLDPVLQSPRGHFFVVSAVALAATFLAVAVATAALRHRNAQVFCLAMGFMSLAALVTLHALSTPGFLMAASPVPNPSQKAVYYGYYSSHASHGSANPLPGVSEQVGLTLAAAWLVLSLVPTSSGFGLRLAPRMGSLGWGWTAALFGGVATTLWNPHWIQALPSSPWWSRTVGVPTALAFAASAWGYWRAYKASHSLPQGATAYAAIWLAAVQWMTLEGTVWRLSWWLHHVLQAAAVLVVVAAVAREYAQPTVRAGWLRPLPSEPEALVRAAATESTRALVAATELRDPYTAGHSRRVTLAALQLGQAMGLPPRALEVLVRGTLVHDVGKLEVPDAVLNKPGPLTPEERRVVQRHPVAGYELGARLGFLPEELVIVRHHHERWDGTGYPDGLKGQQIPLLARIVAVVDVYDALTSDRAYRRAWTPAQARAYVRERAGTQFDPEVVEVWLSLQSEPATQPRAGGHTGGVKRPSTAVQPPSTTSTEPVT
jgi:HD-GYP domain-containing protein (c-di-GMP phosphodiesterase class II)